MKGGREEYWLDGVEFYHRSKIKGLTVDDKDEVIERYVEDLRGEYFDAWIEYISEYQ